MADSPRIEELKRRVQSDPASIAFAALAEEYRRAGRFDEAIETCTTGLVRHPSYLSAHVTLGRALIEVGRLQDARRELEYVLKLAPENLAAIRGLAEIHHRIGDEPSETVSETPETTSEAVPATPQKPEPSHEPRIALRVRAEESADPARAIPLTTTRPQEHQHDQRPLTVVGNRVDDSRGSSSPMPPSAQANHISEPHVAEPAMASTAPPHTSLADLEEFLAAIIRMRTARATAR